MASVDVLVQVSPKREAVVQIDEELVLAGGWRQAAKERAAVLMGWSIFDIERARVGLRPEDRDRLREAWRARQQETGKRRANSPRYKKEETDCHGADGPSQ